MANMLSRNIAKTEFMLISTRQRFRLRSSKQIQIQIIGEISAKLRKLNHWLFLLMTNKPGKFSKRVSSDIGALRRLRPFVSLDTAKKIYDSLI